MHKTRRLSAVSYQLSILFALCVSAAVFSGCQTAVERTFESADVKVTSLYLGRAQPAIEAYCDALAASGAAGARERADQLRLDSQTLAVQILANCDFRLRRLDADQQLVIAARKVLDASGAILDGLQARQAAQEAAHE